VRESHPPHLSRHPVQGEGRILGYGWRLKKDGYRETTIVSRVKMLRSLARRADLSNPEAVKAVIADLDVSDGRKENLVCVYGGYCKLHNIPFEPPRYRRIDQLPFVPLNSEVDQLIARMGAKMSTYLQLLKETGVRAGESWKLRWTDIDAERQAVIIAPEKNSKSTQLKITNRLLPMLERLPRKGEYVFGAGNLDNFARWFYIKRERIAEKLANPRLRRIGFKTLRHFKATMLYHRTRDILLVQRTLGHRDIRNTLVYTHLLDNENDEIVCKAARTVDEAKELVENGFDYVTDVEGLKLFRKRK
jgi:integrase